MLGFMRYPIINAVMIIPTITLLASESSEINTTILSITDRRFVPIARVHAHLFPFKRPYPTGSDINPIIRDRKLTANTSSSEEKTPNAPPNIPTNPKIIERIAMTVIPIGLF